MNAEREKMVREVKTQQEGLMGHAWAELEKAQQEIDRLQGQAESAERERDTSMNQLAAEKIRSTQMNTHCAQLTYEKDVLTSQFVDLTRYATLHGACQDIHCSNREPEGFTDYVDQIVNSEDSGIHLVPPFANQSSGPPPGLPFPTDSVERAPQTPDRRPQHTSASPSFGLQEAMSGSKGSGSTGKGAGSTPNRAALLTRSAIGATGIP
eukprot:5658077-Amphidinium_carterae.2